MNQLQQLSILSTIVADTGDIASIQRLNLLMPPLIPR
jgi:hypothetical protein